MISEADEMDYKQQDREAAESRRRERIRSRLPNIGEPCAHCGGGGSCLWNGADHGGVNCDDPQVKCPHCQGVKP